MNRHDQIQRAQIFRDGNRTMDASGKVIKHHSIGAAKRFIRLINVPCVAQQPGEVLFNVMSKRITRLRKAAETKRLMEEAMKTVPQAIEEHKASEVLLKFLTAAA